MSKFEPAPVISLLLLEDSALDTELTLAHLDRARIAYSHRRVEDRAAFEKAVREHRFDIILSDYSLPSFDALAALAIAKEVCPGVPFIVLSGAAGEELAVESLKQGATDYLLKQHLHRLGPAVRRALVETAERKERKCAQEELSRKAQELQALNADLEQFAYAASHDLQEPLRTISIFSSLLSKRYRSRFDSQADEYLDYIESAARHMSALLEDLLAYTRIPDGQRSSELVHLNALFDQVVFLFRSQIEQNNASVTAGPLPAVLGNSKQLFLVLQNLISNALKYRGSAAPCVTVTTSSGNSAGKCIICVRDNGLGFDQSYAHHVFGLFKRLRKGDTPGTGLGLAICKRIVEHHGGEIWAQSEPDKGSQFFFSLPVPQAQSPIFLQPAPAVDLDV